ncbi:cyclic nucleotide-binding domain-containing protein [Spirillospora sp. NPDC047279]|uniref:Crp/Fnr family transcriptional regulator n=1 Tax=Spirillospora sp. NPDC047279 TaxID=3155478 RepID=UPI0033E05C75
MLGGLGSAGTAALVCLLAGRGDPLAMAAVFCMIVLLVRWVLGWTRLLTDVRDAWAIAGTTHQASGPNGPEFGPALSRALSGPASGSAAEPDAGPGSGPDAEPGTGPDPEPPRGPRRKPRATFWEVLREAEREVLRSMSTRRTFVRGATLVSEGEPAHFVLIILSGWTKISVTEGGRELLLGERGPGQLIGERAALKVNVRSATIIALDTVEALWLPTSSFARFISRHPHVLDIVENQIYDRLTEGPGQAPGGPGPEGGGTTFPGGSGDSGGGGDDDAGEDGDGFPDVDRQNCTIVVTDVVGYASPDRTEEDRSYIEERHLEMVRQSFLRAGIPWRSCYPRQVGDELLVVAPPSVATAQVVRSLEILLALLKTHHRRSAPPVQIRLRAAVSVGPLTTHRRGVPSGDALVRSARMLNADVLRDAVGASGALLGVLASGYVFESVILTMGPGEREGYCEVADTVKETHFTAWMKLNRPMLEP